MELSGSPDDQITSAHRLFAEQRFVEAAAVFKKHPMHPISRYLLGEAYERAPEFSDKRFLALPHYVGAADEVPDFAAIRIAWCYSSGMGVVRSARMAVHWYLIAGHAGVVTGYFNAAHALWVGSTYLKQDRVTAYAWMLIAARLDDKEASEQLAAWSLDLTQAEKARVGNLSTQLFAQRESWRALQEVGTPGVYSQDESVVAARSEAYKAVQRARGRQ